MKDDRLKDKKFIEWAKRVKIEADYTCEICGKRGGTTIVSHHLNSWDKFIDQRYDLDNAACLCEVHHEMFHHIHGFGNNTKEQFEEFKKFCRLIEKITKNGQVELERNISKQIDIEQEGDE